MLLCVVEISEIKWKIQLNWASTHAERIWTFRLNFIRNHPHACYIFSTTCYSLATLGEKCATNHTEMIKRCQNVNYVLQLQKIPLALHLKCVTYHIKPYKRGALTKKVIIFVLPFLHPSSSCNASILGIWNIGFQYDYTSTRTTWLNGRNAWIIIDMVLVCLVVKINWILHRNCVLGQVRMRMPMFSVSIFFEK